MRTALILPALVLAACALVLRSYTLPPAPDRRGGTTVLLTWPNRPVFGSPRADCLAGAPEAPVLPCLIASVARARDDGYALLHLPFCATCYDLSGRIAVMGRDDAASRARLEQIARFGW
jgi:hypothetical protein